MSVCCACCVLSGRDLCDELITRPEESYRLWCVVMCGLETSRMRRPWPALGRSATGKKGHLAIWTLNPPFLEIHLSKWHEAFHVSMKSYFRLLCSFIQAVANTLANFMLCGRGIICVSTEGPLVFAEEFFFYWSACACELVITNR